MSTRAIVIGMSALMLAAQLPGAAAGAGEQRLIPYAGEIVNDPEAKISLEVKTKGQRSRNVRAYFEVDNVFTSCDDGSTKRVNYGEYGFRFVTKRTFHGEVSLESPIPQLEGFYEVKGRLLEDGNARGYLIEVEDRPDPPPSGWPDKPDCTTGKLHWSARPVGA